MRPRSRPRTRHPRAPPEPAGRALRARSARRAWRSPRRSRAEDCQVQSMPDASPTKWHLAHVTWFFETFLLERFEPGFRAVRSGVPRALQQLLQGRRRAASAAAARPGHAADAGRGEALSAPTSTSGCRRCSPARPGDAEIEALVTLGLQHEQQHQELLLTDIKHALSASIRLRAGYARRWPMAQVRPQPLRWFGLRGRPGRARPRRRRSTASSASTTRRRATAPTSRRSRSHRGRSTLRRVPRLHGRRRLRAARALAVDGLGLGAAPAARAAPLYWMRDGDRWLNHTLQGTVEIDPHTPVCHLSYFEADAFARWAGRAAADRARMGASRRARCARRRPATSPTAAPSTRCRRPAPIGDEPVQMFGDVWEWTQSAYLPYPGYRPLPGAVGEYNGKFMCNQFVLRGGSCATPPATCAPATATSSRPTRSGSSAACAWRATPDASRSRRARSAQELSTPSTSEPNSRW